MTWMAFMWCSGLTIACFFFNDTATTEIYPLSLPDALPILDVIDVREHLAAHRGDVDVVAALEPDAEGRELAAGRSEEHTSELQSPCNLVCRLLLENKNAFTTLPAPISEGPLPKMHTHTVTI